MAIRYPKEVHDFIRENVTGTTTADLAKMVNEKFGTQFTVTGMKSYKSKHNLKSGLPSGYGKYGKMPKVFSNEVVDYIIANHKGVGPKEKTERVNEKFGTDYKRSQVKSFYHNHGLNSGLDGKFQKGHQEIKRLGKRRYYPGCEKGWFKKGESWNTMPVGTEKVRGCGYTWIKVAEPNIWKQKHIYLWEQHNGPVPRGKKVIFLDGNKANVQIDNLAMIDNDILLQLNNSKLKSDNKELTKVGITVVTLKRTVAKKRRKNEKSR